MPSRVENLMAQTFPVFMRERLDLSIPSLSASSFDDIFLSASILSNLSTIATAQPLQRFVGKILQQCAVFENQRQPEADSRLDECACIYFYIHGLQRGGIAVVRGKACCDIT